MKLLVCTPIFDSYVPVMYMQRYLETIPVLMQHNIEFSLLTESRFVINVSRSVCARKAMENGFDKILFIDSDIIWNPEDVLRLCLSKHEIVGGAYPFRAHPIKLNIQPVPDSVQGPMDSNEFVRKFADENGEIEVEKIPTGFLKIDVSVFRKMMPHMQSFRHKDPMLSDEFREKLFFPFGISKDGYLLTEDWAFCEEVKKLGYKLYWNSKVVVDHFGTQIFSAKM